MIWMLSLVAILIFRPDASSRLDTSEVSIANNEHNTATQEVFQTFIALTKSDFSRASVGSGGTPPVHLNLANAAVGSMGFS